MMYLIMFFSFTLENILSNYLNGSIFSVLFVVSSLGFIYPMFYKKEKNYFLYALICGLMYDFIFTNTLMFNGLIFLLVALIVHKTNTYLVNSFINTIIITNIVLFSYLLISYIGLALGSYLQFDIQYFAKVFLNNILANVLFSLVFYLVLEKISVKYKILKVN